MLFNAVSRSFFFVSILPLPLYIFPIPSVPLCDFKFFTVFPPFVSYFSFILTFISLFLLHSQRHFLFFLFVSFSCSCHPILPFFHITSSNPNVSRSFSKLNHCVATVQTVHSQLQNFFVRGILPRIASKMDICYQVGLLAPVCDVVHK